MFTIISRARDVEVHWSCTGHVLCHVMCLDFVPRDRALLRARTA